MLSVYDRLQENMSKTIDLYTDLASSKDPQLKKYRFDLQKAVTSTVNAISPQSGEHLIEIISKLRRVLSGQYIEVTGRTLSVNLHPHARTYCCNLLAKKIVVCYRVEASYHWEEGVLVTGVLMFRLSIKFTGRLDVPSDAELVRFTPSQGVWGHVCANGLGQNIFVGDCGFDSWPGK